MAERPFVEVESRGPGVMLFEITHATSPAPSSVPIYTIEHHEFDVSDTLQLELHCAFYARTYVVMWMPDQRDDLVVIRHFDDAGEVWSTFDLSTTEARDLWRFCDSSADVADLIKEHVRDVRAADFCAEVCCGL